MSTTQAKRSQRHIARPKTTKVQAGGFTVTKMEDAAAEPAPPNEPGPQSKQAMVLAMLRSESGATLAQLVEATGWQQHTVRAALTGLKKKGHAVRRTRTDDVSTYLLA